MSPPSFRRVLRSFLVSISSNLSDKLTFCPCSEFSEPPGPAVIIGKGVCVSVTAVLMHVAHPKQSCSPAFWSLGWVIIEAEGHFNKRDWFPSLNLAPRSLFVKSNNDSWLVRKHLIQLLLILQVKDDPPDITHDNSCVCVSTDSGFQTHPATAMPLLVCRRHNEPSSCDWCLFPLISFICSWRLGGAVFQGQWITHPRQGKICTGTLTGSLEISRTKEEGL